MERLPLIPIRNEVAVCRHDAALVGAVRDATLWILANVGLRVDSAKARNILGRCGAAVDAATGIVRMPPDLVEGAMARAPRSFLLGARDPAFDLDLSSGCTFCTTDGCGTEIVDFVTRERRSSTKADVADVTRLIDYLPGLAFWWPTVGAGDCGETAQLHELQAGFENTVKHVQAMVQGERQARAAVEMARAVAGGEAALRRRPVMSNLIGTVSPLVLDGDAMDAALVFAEAGVPVAFVTMPTQGTTAPATKAGAYAVGCAEVVGAATLLQLACPGAPVILSIMASTIHPRSGAFVSFPQDGRGRALATELVHDWGVPAESAACGTDSLSAGTWQAGVEEALDLGQAAFEGSELMPTIGLVATYQVFVPEHLILGHDVYQRARFAVLEVAHESEDLALDVVADVGPAGHYLAHRHTRRHLRAETTLAITHQPAANGGYGDPVEAAREQAEQIYRDYHPEPLDTALAAELQRIVDAADGSLRS